VLENSKLSPFSLFYMIGNTAPNHGVQLDTYAEQLYECLRVLPGIDEKKLCDKMICDWLSMVKGKNMPVFMRINYSKRDRLLAKAESMFKCKTRRSEVAILHDGRGIVVGNSNKNPITLLYETHFVDF
jgi:hypothetical protein